MLGWWWRGDAVCGTGERAHFGSVVVPPPGLAMTRVQAGDGACVQAGDASHVQMSEEPGMLPTVWIAPEPRSDETHGVYRIRASAGLITALHRTLLDEQRSV